MKNHVIDIQLSGDAVDSGAKDFFLDVLKVELPKGVVSLRGKFLRVMTGVLTTLKKNYKRQVALQCRGVGYSENHVFYHPDTKEPVFAYGFSEGGGIEQMTSIYPFHPCTKAAAMRMIDRFVEKNRDVVPDVVIENIVKIVDELTRRFDVPFKIIAGMTSSNVVLLLRPVESEESVAVLILLFAGNAEFELIRRSA